MGLTLLSHTQFTDGDLELSNSSQIIVVLLEISGVLMNREEMSQSFDESVRARWGEFQCHLLEDGLFYFSVTSSWFLITLIQISSTSQQVWDVWDASVSLSMWPLPVLLKTQEIGLHLVRNVLETCFMRHCWNICPASHHSYTVAKHK